MADSVVNPKPEEPPPKERTEKVEETTTGEIKSEPEESEKSNGNKENEEPEPKESEEPPVPPTEPKEVAPPAPPTITIITVINMDDGAIEVFGTSANLPEGAEITVRLAGAIAIALVDFDGSWLTTIPSEEAEHFPIETLSLTASAGEEVTVMADFQNTPLVHGIPISSEEERIQTEIIAEVFEYDHTSATEEEREIFGKKRIMLIERHERLSVMTEPGREAYRRVTEFEQKREVLAENYRSSEEFNKSMDENFEMAFGISKDYAIWLTTNIYLDEKPEHREYMKFWQKNGIALEYLAIRIENPNATKEEWLDLLRESIREDNVSIQFYDWWNVHHLE